MYNSEFSEAAKAQLIGVPYEAIDDLVETVVLACADPWNFRRSPTEPTGDHYAHRTVPFADGRGLLTFLILDQAGEVTVTDVTWLG